MLTVNELFSGIGSQRAALERLGIEHKVVGIAEIDKFAIKSYEAIWGSTKNYGDISKVNKLDYADFWTYSFPCQDISVAGKQAGIEHGKTRSGLLYEVERLLEKSRECDELPKYLMLENVKNLVGKKFKAQFEEWIKRLDELGYNTYWKVLNAKYYGIPQNRERVFGISIRKDIDTGYAFPEPFELKTRLKDILEDEVDEKFYISQEKTEKLINQIKLNNPSIKREPGKADGVYTNQSLSFTRPPLKDLSRTLKANVHDAAVVMPIDKSYNNPKPIEIANCITAREDRGISNRKSEGTAVIEPILFGGMQKNQSIKTDGVSTCLTSSMGTGGGYVPMVTEPIIAASRGRNPNNPSDRTPGSPTEQRLEINQNGTSNTITTVQKDNYVLEPSDKPKLVGGIGKKNFGKQYRQGNRIYDSEAVAMCLNAQLVGNAGGYSYLYKTDYRIRKLTPKECWRLMGFTDEQFQKAEEVNSNSQLYKQAGNSIVVDVLYYIFRNLFIEKPKYRAQVDSEEQIPGQSSILDFM